LKKSVTIDPDVLEAPIPERELVEAWEREHGQFTDDELKPFLESAMRAQVENVMRLMRESRPSKAPARGRRKSTRAPTSPCR
jgi:hypothetical protein